MLTNTSKRNPVSATIDFLRSKGLGEKDLATAQRIIAKPTRDDAGDGLTTKPTDTLVYVLSGEPEAYIIKKMDNGATAVYRRGDVDVNGRPVAATADHVPAAARRAFLSRDAQSREISRVQEAARSFWAPSTGADLLRPAAFNAAEAKTEAMNDAAKALWGNKQ